MQFRDDTTSTLVKITGILALIISFTLLEVFIFKDVKSYINPIQQELSIESAIFKDLERLGPNKFKATSSDSWIEFRDLNFPMLGFKVTGFSNSPGSVGQVFFNRETDSNYDGYRVLSFKNPQTTKESYVSFRRLRTISSIRYDLTNVAGDVITLESSPVLISGGDILKLASRIIIYLIVVLSALLFLWRKQIVGLVVGIKQNAQKMKLGLLTDTSSSVVVKYRYLFVLAVFFVLVLLKVNFSSHGMWNTFITDRPENYNHIQLGPSQTIRSDEFIVGVPFLKAQSEEGYPVVNPNFGYSGSNVLITNLPSWHIIHLFQPLNWGHLLLGFDYGLSWSWVGLLLLLLMSSFELGLLLSKGRYGVALFTSILITFSAPIQWWSFFAAIPFMQTIIISAIHFLKSKTKVRKILFAFLGVCGFVSLFATLYPPFVIPAFYLAVTVILTIAISEKLFQNQKWIDWLILAGAATTFIIVFYVFYRDSQSVISVMSSTSYPGQRISTGGDTPISYLYHYTNSFLLPRGSPGYLNNSEAASFINFILPIVGFLLIFKSKSSYIWPIGLFTVFFYVYCFIGIPLDLAKITALTMVPGPRAFHFMLLSSIYVLVVLLSNPIEKVELTKANLFKGLIILVLYLGVLFIELLKPPFLYDVGPLLLVTLLLFGIPVGFFLLSYRKLFMIYMMLFTFACGAFVNPVVFGTSAISDTSFEDAVKTIEVQNPKSRWIASDAGPISYLLYGFGVQSLSGVQYYPNLDFWKILDKSGANLTTYNRYAHVHYSVVAQETPSFTNPQADVLLVQLPINSLKDLSITHVVAVKDLTSMSTDEVTFTKVYGPDTDGLMIFELRY